LMSALTWSAVAIVSDVCPSDQAYPFFFGILQDDLGSCQVPKQEEGDNQSGEGQPASRSASGKISKIVTARRS
jgi:hypothetical protein